MKEKYGLEEDRLDYRLIEDGSGRYIVNATLSEKKKLENDFQGIRFELVLEPQYSDTPGLKPTGLEVLTNLEKFPKDPYVNNTTTDFTKFTVPAKGATVKLNKENIAWYRRIITAYEGHTLKETKDGIYIDGKKASSYTFAMNYYWLMGDNRYNSADSRVWGFVPEDHVVGRASIVWLSNDPYGGFRWERVFKGIK
jgi:signal peptidase I